MNNNNNEIDFLELFKDNETLGQKILDTKNEELINFVAELRHSLSNIKDPKHLAAAISAITTMCELAESK